MSTKIDQTGQSPYLEYTILCEDVRLEAGNKLTIVGVFQGIFVPQLPVTILKFAVLNHWRGEGQYLTEVRILTPNRTQAVVASHPSSFQIQPNGYADNVNIFANVTFPVEGEYVVQTLINSTLYAERLLPVGVVRQEGSFDSLTESHRIH
ncbi:MAG: hypothetical protein RMM98_12485 [Acidobacteriota bacterium]|nr:hypothetical protein [Blastocatellia bacterium]MDW8240427.1 hypothetical protein [Acidobacteriota bacterium]